MLILFEFFDILLNIFMFRCIINPILYNRGEKLKQNGEYVKRLMSVKDALTLIRESDKVITAFGAENPAELSGQCLKITRILKMLRL